jgi:hypothetical protein
MPVKCKDVTLVPCGPLGFKIQGGTTSIVPHYSDEEGKVITSLDMPTKYSIKLKDVIKVKKKPYKVNIIERSLVEGVLTYTAKIAERTKCSLFLLPMLGGSRRSFFYNHQLLNVFLGWGDMIDKIVLLYRWSGDPLFAKFEQKLKQYKNFEESHDPSAHHVVFVFSVPVRHKENYKNLKAGKYSKMDDDYKFDLLEFHDMHEGQALGQILFRSEERRINLECKLDADIDKQSELLSVLDMNKEVLDLEHYLSAGVI